MLAESYSFCAGADYEPPEQTFDHAGTFTSDAHFKIYSRTYCNVTSLG